MHNWGASKARLMSGLSALLQLLDLACHTHSNQPCKNYRLHWFLVFICECLWVCVRAPEWDEGCVCVCACTSSDSLCMCTQLHMHISALTCVFSKCTSGVVRPCSGESRSHIWSSELAARILVILVAWSSVEMWSDTHGLQTTWSLPIITVRVIVKSPLLALLFSSASSAAT